MLVVSYGFWFGPCATLCCILCTSMLQAAGEFKDMKPAYAALDKLVAEARAAKLEIFKVAQKASVEVDQGSVSGGAYLLYTMPLYHAATTHHATIAP